MEGFALRQINRPGFDGVYLLIVMQNFRYPGPVRNMDSCFDELFLFDIGQRHLGKAFQDDHLDVLSTKLFCCESNVRSDRPAYHGNLLSLYQSGVFGFKKIHAPMHSFLARDIQSNRFGQTNGENNGVVFLFVMLQTCADALSEVELNIERALQKSDVVVQNVLA